ncbi:GCN5-related N-acetyltransferase [Sphingomonas taxi]|uniref:GCN5-related N-acetyltransferase n=1 Tax=Sphingomonas taxi TaxID=1549858 RepID=UPI000AF46AEE|nr:GCN5-related N-acetyltransferase [Sphingomonas taxi]
MAGADTRRAALEVAWLTLTRGTLPGLAGLRMWPVRADHCFQRILLDAAVGGIWYDAVEGRPAYRFIAVDLLERAVSLGQGAAEGTVDLAALNRQSLTWRRERKAAAPTML